ncbi:MAG: hypothetical protein OXM61_03760 [Candidatus Poribacteria bacterium]|nr:hypothetical protein [Candidatus Poribacteria bacterium]
MHKRIATGLFVLIFVLGVAIVFYHQYTDIQQLKQEAAEAEKLLEEQHKGIAENDLPPAEPGKKWVPHGDHFHQVPIDAPDVWQGEPHEPVVTDEDVTPEVKEKPDWIYDPDREKPEGWNPKLVFENGDTKIDLNYFRPLTEEEQAEYERLKATRDLENYGDNVEAEFRLVAIVNMQTKLWQQVRDAMASGHLDEAENLRTEYDEIYGRFPVSD